MSEALVVRLDAEMRRRLLRAAKRRRTTTSAVVRQAIEAWLERDAEAAAPAGLLVDLIGCVHGRDSRRSEGGGDRVARELRLRRQR